MISRFIAQTTVFVGTTVVGLSLYSGIANAIPVTTLPGGNVVPFPTVNIMSMGPETVASGITWTSTTPFSVYGYSNIYSFETNGTWNVQPNQLVMVGLDAAAGTMTLQFTHPVAGVGGLLNYDPNNGTGPARIAVYDSNKNLLDSYDLTFLISGDNTGQFLGFLESTADIKYFALSNRYIGLTDFTVLAQAPTPPTVPEPGTLALLGAALAGIGIRRRNLHC